MRDAEVIDDRARRAIVQRLPWSSITGGGKVDGRSARAGGDAPAGQLVRPDFWLARCSATDGVDAGAASPLQRGGSPRPCWSGPWHPFTDTHRCARRGTFLRLKALLRQRDHARRSRQNSGGCVFGAMRPTELWKDAAIARSGRKSSTGWWTVGRPEPTRSSRSSSST